MERKTKSPQRKKRWATATVALPTKRRRVTPTLVRARGGIARGINPLPHNLKTRLAYNQRVTLTAGAADGTARHVFCASSLYDPDQTGSGHQPMGFDQLMPMYDHYVVLGSKITARFYAPVAIQPARVGISGQPVLTGREAEEYMEQGDGKSAALGFYSNVPVVTNFYSPLKHMGSDDPANQTKLQGSVSSNPTDNWFFHVWAHAIDAAAITTGIIADVTIEYLVQFIEPQQLAQS